MERKKRYRFGKVSLDGIGRNARPPSIWVKVLVLAAIVAPIIWSFFSDYWYHEDRPTFMGVKRYLLWHGAWQASISVVQDWDEYGDAVTITLYTNRSDIDRWIGRITSLRRYTKSFDSDLDLRDLVDCRKLGSLGLVGVGRFFHEELFTNFPMLVNVNGYVRHPIMGKIGEGLGEGWTLRLNITRDNLDEICRCDNPGLYRVYVSVEFLESLDESILRNLRSKKFKGINDINTDDFWNEFDRRGSSCAK